MNEYNEILGALQRAAKNPGSHESVISTVYYSESDVRKIMIENSIDGDVYEPRHDTVVAHLKNGSWFTFGFDWE